MLSKRFFFYSQGICLHSLPRWYLSEGWFLRFTTEGMGLWVYVLLPECLRFTLLQCVVWSFSWAPGHDETGLWLVLIRSLSMVWVRTADVVQPQLPVMKSCALSLPVLTPGSQILSALFHCHTELFIAFSHSHWSAQSSVKLSSVWPSLVVFYSTGGAILKVASKTASLKDLQSSQGYV